jgi:CheY-like chemotaxis protein
MSTDERSFPERDAGSHEGTVTALEALEGLPVSGGARLKELRLAHVVAATLRAAIDALSGPDVPRRPIAITGDDGAFEVTLADVRGDQLEMAAALMETVEGNLGAVGNGTAYRLRVPAASVRGLYLMLEQGTLGFAIPWHAVIRIRLARPEAIEQVARRGGYRVLPSWVEVPRGPGECPAVLIGLGLRRAYLLADRLIWRMAAEPEPASETAPRGSGFSHAVRATDGALYWVADPVRLLEGVESPPLLPAARRARTGGSRPVPPAPVTTPTPSAPAPIPLPAPRPAPAAPARPAGSSGLQELRAEDSEPLPPPADRREAAPRRRAVVVEETVVGRIFLQRLLESLGFDVHTAENAHELEQSLGLGPWDLALIDVALPDSPRGEHLIAARARGDIKAVVALVRDRRDEQAAIESGVVWSLRRPFERADLMQLLRHTGLDEARS